MSSTRPSILKSIPFWGLIAGSAASLGYGYSIVAQNIGLMTTTLTDGTATGLEVYVGQSQVTVGSIVMGAGILGLLLALAVASLSTLRAKAPVEIVEPIDWTSEAETASEQPAAGHGYERGLGYTEAIDMVDGKVDAKDADEVAPTR